MHFDLAQNNFLSETDTVTCFMEFVLVAHLKIILLNLDCKNTKYN
jgi:hypothetical protein